MFSWEQFGATSGQWCPLNGTINDKIKYTEMGMHLHSGSVNISCSWHAERAPGAEQGALRSEEPLGSWLCPGRL